MSIEPKTAFQRAVKIGYENGWSVREIAEATGSTPGSVKVTASVLGVAPKRTKAQPSGRRAPSPITLGGPSWAGGSRA